MLNRLGIHLSTLVLLGVTAIASLAPVPATAQTNMVNICDRTLQVEARILAAISDPPPDCDTVLASDLAGITSLSLAVAGINSLASGDFTGLSGLVTLNLSLNALTTLPPDVFDGLSALETLILNGTSLTTLPAGVFDGLSAFVTLNLNQNRLTTLPAGVFDGLSTLESLFLSNNALTTLPAGVFDGLTALDELLLSGNAFTTLPVGVFDDVLDTLGPIGTDNDASFRVDNTVRNAHFVCSRSDAATIVANTPGVDDCLRITSAQLITALPNVGLSALTISQGTLTPEFDRTTFTYSATVPNDVATLTITPTAAGSGATVAGTVPPQAPPRRPTD